jgi:hypothetical protein
MSGSTMLLDWPTAQIGARAVSVRCRVSIHWNYAVRMSLLEIARYWSHHGWAGRTAPAHD